MPGLEDTELSRRALQNLPRTVTGYETITRGLRSLVFHRYSVPNLISSLDAFISITLTETPTYLT